MARWFEKECRPFDLYETEDGWFYQAVGTPNNRERIEAIEIIKAIDEIALNEKRDDYKIKGLRLWFCRIDGHLDIGNANNLKPVKENGIKYIQLPNIDLSFLNTVFEGMVSFGGVKFGKSIHFHLAQFEKDTGFGSSRFRETTFYKTRFVEDISFVGAQFGEYTIFSGAQFEGEEIDFSDAQFQLPARFARVKYWSDSVKVTLARVLWRIGIRGKFLRCILFLPKNCPEGKPPKPVMIYRERDFKREGAQFYLDSKNIDEVSTLSNPHFKRYVADQQYLRSFQENHRIIHWLWRWSSDCGRSIGLWTFWSLLIAFLFALAYTPSPDWMPDWWCNFWEKYGTAFQQTAEAYKGKPLSFWSSFYFSIVTFTTLGFGDVVAANPFARFLVTLEVILGYIMLGGLISIFANKLARRS